MKANKRLPRHSIRKRSVTRPKRIPLLPYHKQPRLITEAELRFLHTGLQPAVGDRFYIGVQIPMTAIIRVDDDHWDKAAGRKIRQKRMDFVLAYPKTFRIAAVIELDDASHEQPQRQKRDRFVEAAFDAAGVLLIRFGLFRKYDSDIIRRKINAQLRRHAEQA